jgi:hypothetical protein
LSQLIAKSKQRLQSYTTRKCTFLCNLYVLTFLDFRTEHRSQALVEQQAGLGGKRRGGAVGVSRGSGGGEDGLVAEDDDDVLVDESTVRV